MPRSLMIIATPETPITLRYEYNWENSGVLAIKFSHSGLADILRQLNKPNLAATQIKIFAELENRSGHKITVELPFPTEIRYKSYRELMNMENQTNIDSQTDV